MKIAGSHFVDGFGRYLILRGVNLGGDSKVPSLPDGRTHHEEGFYEGKNVSFVGRPFPLEEADEHFARLSSWGQRFLRFLVTWEAVEHEGPDIYDSAYLEYLEGIADSAARHGISLFIDPHQDVWSRWTGGDGAPLWTLEAVGFEPRNFHVSGAALLQQESGASYPRMEWFSNHFRLACATMFSLFFAGNDLAQGVKIEGETIQDYLQNHYIAAMRQVVRRLARCPNVVGIDTLNEPGKGFIGIQNIQAEPRPYTLPGLAPSPWETMQAGEGFPANVNHIGLKGLGLGVVRRETLGTPGARAWKEGEICIWRRAGVWDIQRGKPLLLKPACFAAGDFNETFLKPFIQRFTREIRAEAAAAGKTGFTLFIEGPAHGEVMPSFKKGEFPDIVNAAHWYDAFTLTFKRWTGFLAFDTEKNKVIIGPKAVRSYFREAMERVLKHSHSAMGGIPSLLGEFGLPFDLNGRHSFARGDYRTQEKALSAYYNALDASLMNATIWNYSASNTHAFGDGWNGEDLSVFCIDEINRPKPGSRQADATDGLTGLVSQSEKIDSGGRALRGFVRPYAMATAGRPLGMSFNRETGEFRYSFEADFSIEAPTEIFVPRIQYPEGYDITAKGCRLVPPANTGSAPNADPLSETNPNAMKPLLPDPSHSFLSFVPETGAALCEIVIARRRTRYRD